MVRWPTPINVSRYGTPPLSSFGRTHDNLSIAREFVGALLEYTPTIRVTLAAALQHAWLVPHQAASVAALQDSCTTRSSDLSTTTMGPAHEETPSPRERTEVILGNSPQYLNVSPQGGLGTARFKVQAPSITVLNVVRNALLDNVDVGIPPAEIAEVTDSPPQLLGKRKLVPHFPSPQARKRSATSANPEAAHRSDWASLSGT